MDELEVIEKIKGFIKNRNVYLKFGIFYKYMLNINNMLDIFSWWRKSGWIRQSFYIQFWCGSREILVELEEKKIIVFQRCFLRENGRVNSKKNMKIKIYLVYC